MATQFGDIHFQGAITFETPPDANDPAAFHGDVADEITALTAKATIASGDVIAIEDSAAAFVKKKYDLGAVLVGIEDALDEILGP